MDSESVVMSYTKIDFGGPIGGTIEHEPASPPKRESMQRMSRAAERAVAIAAIAAWSPCPYDFETRTVDKHRRPPKSHRRFPVPR